jgi:hypothetical protein
MSNPLVHIERIPEQDAIVVRKSRGALSLDDIPDALRDHNMDDAFALFFKATVFDGYLGKNERCSAVKLYNVSTADACPACGRRLDEAEARLYEEAYRAGYQDALDEKGEHTA